MVGMAVFYPLDTLRSRLQGKVPCYVSNYKVESYSSVYEVLSGLNI